MAQLLEMTVYCPKKYNERKRIDKKESMPRSNGKGGWGWKEVKV